METKKNIETTVTETLSSFQAQADVKSSIEPSEDPYRQINQVSFQESFKVLIAHYQVDDLEFRAS